MAYWDPDNRYRQGVPACPSPARKIIEETALRAVVQGTAGETGESFYRALVRNLSLALDTRGAWLTEYKPGASRLQALAFWFGNDWVDDFVYGPSGNSLREGHS